MLGHRLGHRADEQARIFEEFYQVATTPSATAARASAWAWRSARASPPCSARASRCARPCRPAAASRSSCRLARRAPWRRPARARRVGAAGRTALPGGGRRPGHPRRQPHAARRNGAAASTASPAAPRPGPASASGGDALRRHAVRPAAGRRRRRHEVIRGAPTAAQALAVLVSGATSPEVLQRLRGRRLLLTKPVAPAKLRALLSARRVAVSGPREHRRMYLESASRHAALSSPRPATAACSARGLRAQPARAGATSRMDQGYFDADTLYSDSDSLVTRARNRLVAEFMADTRWTHLFWIDADIGFEPEAALRLLLAGREVVAGIYPRKTDGWPAEGLHAPMPQGSTRADFEARHAQFPFNALGEPRTVDAEGLVEVLDAPTGFMLIERSVFTKLAAAMPELRYTPDSALDARAADWPHYRFFDVMAEPGDGSLTEDYAFCRRWQSVGGRVFADARSRLERRGAAHPHRRPAAGARGACSAAVARSPRPRSPIRVDAVQQVRPRRTRDHSRASTSPPWSARSPSSAPVARQIGAWPRVGGRRRWSVPRAARPGLGNPEKSVPQRVAAVAAVVRVAGAAGAPASPSGGRA